MKRGLLTGLLLALGVVSAKAQTLYDDFETTPGSTRLVTYRPTTGGTLIQNQMNPGANAVNMSSTVARYTRAATDFDNFDIETPRPMADVTPYITGIKHMTMKFYSPAAGTQVMLVLQNKAKNRSAGYPAGKYLGEFKATTSLTNAWQTLTFTFNSVDANNFDATVTATTIDEITVLIAPATTGTGTYHFDDINGPELSSGTGTPTAAPAVTQLFDDFDATRKLSYPGAGAVFTPGLTAPAGNSTVVGRYVRGADAYDQLQMAPANATFFDDVSGFASATATVKPSLKFYNPTAAAIPVRLIFANNALRGNNAYSTGNTGIAGTHSVYTATTSAAAGWQTLTFTYQTGPNAGAYDASVKSTAIDRVLLQINPGAGVGNQYHIDDITLPAATIPVAKLYENFRDVRSLSYVGGDGVLTQSAANPSTTGSNPNPTVGKYDRSANMYDAFYVKLPTGAVADDVTDFFNGTRKMTMKVYSPRPAGAIVTIYMLDNTATGNNYPNGRDAYYQATTTKQNEWETLTFTLTTRLGAGVAQQRNINGFGIQLGDNSTATGTWYFDQFYGPNFTIAPGTLYDNFENTRQLTYTAATGGTLNASYTNPAVFDENYSATVGHYTRSANATDVLLARATGKQLDDVSSYVSGTNSFYLKVFSKTIGTPVRLLLQNAAKAGSTGTSTGTHSVFQANTTKSNQWETLRFTYQAGGSTDGTVTATQVDQLALLFNPGSTAGGQTFDFDFFVGQSLITATAPPAGTAITQLYDDFENTRQLTLKQVDGAFTPGTGNPAFGAGNSSIVVGRYVRSANPYDTFEMAPANATFFNDVTGFASPTATVKATMKIYSTVAGTAQLVFANAATTTGGNYPTGRHSIYTAPITAAGWQTLTFTYQLTPDASVKGTAVDRIQLQLTPGTGATGTYYFDDITLPATTMPVARLYENFNDVRELTYGAGDGVLTQNFANPSTTGTNANPLVGKYVRSAVAYDTFYANYPAGATADDISDFVSGSRKMTMKVYAPAAGRPVTITLLDATATPTNYPTGRNSFYTATTTVANAWETLTFNFAGTPTGGVNPVKNISGINIQFDGGNGAASTWYFDQLYGPNFTAAPGALYDNFETVREMTYVPDGTLTQNFANPSVFGANYSPTVARYQRAATANAAIKITPNGGKRLTNVSAYASTTATKFFYLKVFSQRIGTPVELQLQNAAKATGGANGVQSIFTATTTKSNQWETLQFAYQAANPGVTTDATVSVNQVNQLSLRFNPGDAAAGQIYHFDFFVGQDLLLATGLTWNGSVSSDWNDGDNWSGGTAPVAVSGAPATIPGGLSRYPILTAGNTYGSPDIIINAGGSLTQTGGTFNLANGVTNNGTYNQTGGITNLAGNGSHIFGNGNPMLFYDLNVGTGGMGLLGGPNGTISVKHRMVVAGPVTMNASGKLILLSDATGTAMVVNRGTGSVTGNVVVQRYIDPSLNAAEGYRHLSSPVNGQTVANLKTTTGSVPVVNPAYNTAPVPYTVTPFPTVFSYDESRLTNANATTSGFFYGWKSPAATTEALTNGLGYTVNMAPGTVTFTGPLHTGTYTVPLTRGATANSGWALLGNPYPGPINWDSLARPAGVENALYTFRSNSQYGGAYQSYVNGVGPTGSNLVAMGQGFFTRVVSGSSTMTFTNAARMVSYANPAQYRSSTTADARPRLDLALTAANGASDVLYVYQETGATTGFDSHFDALKVTLNGGQQPTLYQQAGTESFSIQGLPAGQQPVTMALGVDVPVAGTFTFTAEQLANFPGNASVLLEDTQTNTWHDLRNGSYAVTLPQGLHATRFVLHLYSQRALATAGPRAATALLAYPNPATAGTVVRLTNATATGEVLNITGQVVGTFANGKVATAGLAAGVYMLRNAATGERSKLVVQ
ncbi:T9SS type A sorting domain-containing protein [Hymenobacter sp. ASUV-10]|uniref:T9SS type A sorting domain-containing protein n=1 Tax=Hymenobacter aranciens TaxID=3063996 RepID=A0ABT9B8C6_9BACT|nr:T9SS type A sorting domain-containing protein [Hymenobacter sp. ASUV-10]MDO7874515.1 T9SS type A sorting domain-containing protein [Hymenobacter sp. ASUV-10]